MNSLSMEELANDFAEQLNKSPKDVLFLLQRLESVIVPKFTEHNIPPTLENIERAIELTLRREIEMTEYYIKNPEAMNTIRESIEESL